MAAGTRGVERVQRRSRQGRSRILIMRFSFARRGSILLLPVLLALLMRAVHAAPPGPASPDTLLTRVQQYAGNEQARFHAALVSLEKQYAHLNRHQQQWVEYWRAWEALNKGEYARSSRLLRRVVDQADDPVLVARARNKLVKIYMINRKYVEAFTLSNRLIADLDKIHDSDVRNRILLQAIEILVWQKQYDRALKFARQLKADATSAADRCKAEYSLTNILLQRGGQLTSSSPQLRDTVDLCLKAGMLGYANTLRLNWASLMDDEGQPERALALLRRITPEIMKAGFQAHVTSLYVTRAQAYLIKGQYARAIRWARASLSASVPGSFTWTRQAAYKVLYQAQEHTGRFRQALASLKRYMAQYQASTNDTRAQALAYQVVQQEVQTKRLKLAKLARENRILQLRQSLNAKSAETTHLYMVFLLLILASIVFWAWRTKHSQIRFRRLARHDELTGIYNRPYFFEQAEQILHRLHKTQGPACLMILDMDHFKRINDAHGHASGDIVLRHVARVCREQLRDSDVFGRLGGEEFAILMPGTRLDQAASIGERVRRALAQAPVRVGEDWAVTITTSIGLAGTDTHGHALKPLLIAADHALYEAKRGGRNRVVSRTRGPSRPVQA